MNSILITGGAGFVGRNFAAALAARGQEVTVLDDLSCANSSFDCPQLQSPRITCVNGSIRDESLIGRLISEHPTVVHFAAVVGVEETISHPFATTENLTGTLNVARALTPEHLAMFGSSADVYGAHSHYYRGRPMKEDDFFVYEHAGVNRWVYPHVKALEENLISNSAARSVNIRFFNTYGPDMDYPAPKRVVPHFIESALSQKPLRLSGDGKQVRTLCHIDDTVAGLLLALDHLAKPEAPASDCFNIGGSDPVSIRELAETFVALAVEEGFSDTELPIQENAFGYSRNFDDSWDRVPDISYAGEKLGFAPTVGLIEGLRQTLRHYRTLLQAESGE